jgi:hypothetical protein
MAVNFPVSFPDEISRVCLYNFRLGCHTHKDAIQGPLGLSIVLMGSAVPSLPIQFSSYDLLYDLREMRYQCQSSKPVAKQVRRTLT